MADQDPHAEEQAILAAIAAGNADTKSLAEQIDRFPDPQRAYELATMLANAKRQETGIATATRLRQVKRLWESANMTLTELGKRLGGVTKQRAKRMLQTAETPPADS